MAGRYSPEYRPDFDPYSDPYHDRTGQHPLTHDEMLILKKSVFAIHSGIVWHGMIPLGTALLHFKPYMPRSEMRPTVGFILSRNVPQFEVHFIYVSHETLLGKTRFAPEKVFQSDFEIGTPQLGTLLQS